MEYTIKNDILLVAYDQFFEAAAVDKAEDTNQLRDLLMETGVKKIFLVVGGGDFAAVDVDVDDPVVKFVRPSLAPAGLLNPNVKYLVGGNKVIDSELELDGATTWDEMDEAAMKELQDMCLLALADLEVAGGEVGEVGDEGARGVLEWYEELPEIEFVEVRVAGEVEEVVAAVPGETGEGGMDDVVGDNEIEDEIKDEAEEDIILGAVVDDEDMVLDQEEEGDDIEIEL